MRWKVFIVVISGLIAGAGAFIVPQAPAAQATGAQAAPPDDVKTLVGRLELENYKAILKGRISGRIEVDQFIATKRYVRRERAKVHSLLPHTWW